MAVDKTPKEFIYMYSLDVYSEERIRSGNWKVEIHLDDPNCQGGVKHVTLGSGNLIFKEDWILLLALRG